MKFVTFTFFDNKKSNCITQEDLEVLYNIDEDVDRQSYPSIGEDLECFLQRIKSGQICTDMTPYKEESQGSFNSCLLTPEEMVKLHQKDQNFLKTFTWPDPDVPKAKMDQSESKKKFSKSFGHRRTFFMNHVGAEQ